MKEIGAWRLAFVYAGCFLGAGYVSGQEMWQFFGVFGIGGVWGLMLAAVLQVFFCSILLSLVRNGNIYEIDRVAMRRDRPFLRALIGGAQLLLLIGVSVIMSAGVGALTEQMLGRGGMAASALFCLLVFLTAMRGMRGLVSVFSVTVPLLVFAALTLAVFAVLHFGGEPPSLPTAETKNPFLSHWIIGAVSFVSYNLFGSIAVLIPTARILRDRRAARRGAVLAAAMLFPVAVAILLSLRLAPEAVDADLPMLALAQMIHPAVGRAFALLLLAAMFGTALSCVVAVHTDLARRFAAPALYPALSVFVLTVIAFVGGLFGFGELIGWIYPIFGYLGFAVLCAIVAHERHLRRRAKEKEKS